MNAVEFLANHNVTSRKASLPAISVVEHVPDTVRTQVAPVSARQEPIQWRGHGGRHPTNSSVEFDRQLDKISIWLEGWSHDTRCAVLEAILRRSNHTQFQFLYTVMQPSLHRDFMYTANTRFPDIEFKPISTHISRELKDKLTRLRLDTFHRVKSAYLQTDNGHTLKLPTLDPSASGCHVTKTLPSSSRGQKSGKPRLHRSVTLNTNALSIGHEALPTDRRYQDSSRTDASDPAINDAVLRFVEMPVRRHMQDESSPRRVHSHPSPRKPSITESPRRNTRRRTMSKVILTDASPRAESSKSKSRKAQLTLSAAERVAFLYEQDLPPEANELIGWYTQQWNDVKKNEFFHKLLLKLDQRQHYFISSFLALKQHKDFIALLPESISLKILSYLSPKELVEASRVSKTWHRLTNHNSLWEVKCQEVKLEVPISENPIWKRVFRDNLYLKINWSSGDCRIIDFKGHSQSVFTVTFEGDRLASGGADKTVRVWDIKTGELLQVLKGHTKGVWCLQFFTEHLLVSGSFDTTIRIWNLRTGTTSRTLLGHVGPVWALVRRGNILVSGSQDRTAKIWDVNRCMLMNTLYGHNAAIFAVDMNESGSMVITGSADRSVRLWSTDTGKCKKVVWVSQTTSIMSVSYSHGYVACSYGSTICLYHGSKLIKTFNEHRKRVETVKLRINPDTGEGVIVSGGRDALVKYWDISKDDSVQTFTGHSENVNCLHIDQLRIASASYDGKIRLWDFNI